jgi:hypothetical protein
MPAARRPLTAAVAACTLSVAAAAPAVGRPAGHGPARPCVGCARDARFAPGMRTSSLAGTTEAHRRIAPAPVAIAAPDGDGATALAVILIAGGALLAGGGAGFAGGRRVALRPR